MQYIRFDVILVMRYLLHIPRDRVWLLVRPSHSRSRCCISHRPSGKMCGRWQSCHVHPVLSPDFSALMPFAPESLYGKPAIVRWTFHSTDQGFLLSHEPVTFWRVYNLPDLSDGHYVTPLPPLRSSSVTPWCSAASVFGLMHAAQVTIHPHCCWR